MRVLINVPYYAPESFGPAVFIEHLAKDLTAKGHQVTMLTAFPHFPAMVVFDGYKRKLLKRENLGGVNVIRTWIYANAKRAFGSRVLNWGSFCVTSFFGGLLAPKCDVVYCILWPLPLGITAAAIARLKGAKLVVNVQDMYPDIAISLGLLKNPRVIRFFQRMEKWIYRKSAKIVVISEGFKENLVAKGVPPEKIEVVPNWADPEFIQPGPKDNSFRRELGANGRYTVVYSGGLTHNSDLEPVIRAAGLLREEPFEFAIVGDGIHKPALTALADELELPNIQFKPFQPIERYAEVLNAADVTLVTLNDHSTYASVPSKIFKQMAAGRPVIAITAKGNEVDRMIGAARCGISVAPGDPEALAQALRWAERHRDEMEEMGRNSRAYLEKHHGRADCVNMLETVFQRVANDVREQ